MWVVSEDIDGHVCKTKYLFLVPLLPGPTNTCCLCSQTRRKVDQVVSGALDSLDFHTRTSASHPALHQSGLCVTSDEACSDTPMSHIPSDCRGWAGEGEVVLILRPGVLSQATSEVDPVTIRTQQKLWIWADSSACWSLIWNESQNTTWNLQLCCNVFSKLGIGQQQYPVCSLTPSYKNTYTPINSAFSTIASR